jgi:hypothetical protein
LAYQFIYQYALNPDYVYPLIDYISKTKVAISLSLSLSLSPLNRSHSTLD